MRSTFVTALVLVTACQAKSASLEACGQVVAAVGSTCEQLKVTLDLSSCGESKKPVSAKVQCKDSEAIATYRGPAQNYRAVLAKTDSNWGASEFSVKGKVWRHLRQASAVMTTVAEILPQAAKPNESATPALLPAAREPANAQDIRPTPPPTQAAAPAPVRVREEDLANLVALFAGWNVKGSVDAYYGYNANGAPSVNTTPTASNPQAQNKYHVFDLYNDDLQLSYARLQLQKVSGKLTTTLDFGFGPAMQAVAGAKTDASQINLKQAIIGYKPVDSLNIEGGKFVTYLGYELIESQDNWNYSRGVLFGYFVPFWHQGVKITETLNDNLAVMIAVTDGWNNSYNQNRQKTFGGEIAWTPNDKAAFYLNVISGQDYVPSNVSAETPIANRTVYDFVATLKASSKLSFAVNADYLAHSHYKAWGVAGYARYQFDDQWSLSPRVEYVNDKSNLALGESFAAGQILSTYTLTLEDKITSNLAIRLEGRVDKSSQDAFVQQTTPRASQTLGILGFVASF